MGSAEEAELLPVGMGLCPCGPGSLDVQPLQDEGDRTATLLNKRLRAAEHKELHGHGQPFAGQ